jgi:imidazolonepropionase
MLTLVKNIRQLVTPRGIEPVAGPVMEDLRIYEDVTLVVRDDRIVAVEPSSVHHKGDHVIDAAGGVVVPGLVDACVAAQGHGVDVVRDPHSCSAAAEEEQSQKRLRSGVETLLRHGTTSAQVVAVARDDDSALEGVLASLQQLARRTPLRLSAAFLAAPPTGTGEGSSDRITKLIGETIPTVSRRRLASTCALLCGDGAYGRKEGRALLRAARGAGLSLRIQAAGADVEAILLAADLEAAAIDHLSEGVSDARQLKPLRQAGTLPVLLPGESLLHGRPSSARVFVQAGLAVALGTAADLAAGGILSMWTVVALAVRSCGLSLSEALTAATLNGAAAIGASREAGSLETGKFADCVILDLDDYRAIPDFVVGLPIRAVIVGGRELSAP